MNKIITSEGKPKLEVINEVKEVFDYEKLQVEKTSTEATIADLENKIIALKEKLAIIDTRIGILKPEFDVFQASQIK